MNDAFCGIVIEYREYREHDALLSVLRDDGVIIKISAKGIQKVKSKNAPACQLFTYSRWYLNYRETSTMQSLKSAEILESYRHIREDLIKQSIAAYFCEMILYSHFETPFAFDLLKHALDILKSQDDPMVILCLFQVIVNRMHGIEMQCDDCVRCGTTKGIYAISLKDGGFICKMCAKGYDKVYSSKDLKCFRLLNKAQLEHYDILKEIGGFRFEHFEQLYAFFEEYAGIPIKSIQFLRILKDMS